jgi:hypothetical protein
MTISIKDFDNQEVCIWLNAIGLGSKVGPFRDNAVDGDLLCSLSQEDLTNDLGLSGLQVRMIDIPNLIPLSLYMCFILCG